MNKTVVFGVGFAAGVTTTKVIPKTKVIQHIKLITEAFRARSRLQKICIEEYERFDDAMDTEQKFFDMMSANLGLDIKFRLKDEDGQRSVGVIISRRDLKND